MNTWMIIGIAFGVLFAFLIYEIARRKRRVATAAQSPATKPQLAVVDVYRGLRQMALTGSRVEIGLPEPTSPTTPWRVVMDWGLESGALTTVVAVSDGSASIYYGSGGGAIGGIGHESVRLAAIKTVKIAGELKPQMRLTKDFPLPQSGAVIFYAVTDAGVFTASATNEEMRSHRSEFYKLWDAAQGVITEFRAIQGK